MITERLYLIMNNDGSQSPWTTGTESRRTIKAAATSTAAINPSWKTYKFFHFYSSYSIKYKASSFSTGCIEIKACRGASITIMPYSYKSSCPVLLIAIISSFTMVSINLEVILSDKQKGIRQAWRI